MVAKEDRASVEPLRNYAAGAILEASSSTDELTDEEAQPLITWCLLQAEAAADALAAPAAPGVSPSGDAREMLAVQVATVRRLMREINELAGERGDLEPQQVYGKLEAIRALAEELPVAGGTAVPNTALAELAAWQTGLDTGEFVGALLYLLQARGTEG
jgi:hypothetical protein